MKYAPYISEFANILQNIVVTDREGKVLDTQSALDDACKVFASVKETGGCIYLIGNGGSSGIISHTAVDFTNACKLKAYPLTDNSMLTCYANDYGYENIFNEPLSHHFTDKDVLLSVSSSGNSENIVRATNTAHSKGGKTVTFSGFKPDNKLRNTGDINIWLDSTSYGFVEIGHSLVIHYIIDILAGNV